MERLKNLDRERSEWDKRWKEHEKELEEQLERQRGGTKQEVYNEYMHSPEWRAVRNEAFKRDGFKCQRCGSGKNLQGHHVSYENFMRPGEVDDVITLCYACHQAIHSMDTSKMATGGNNDNP